MESTYNLTVNGQRRTVTTDAERPLLDVLREDLQLTGTKYGCGEGQCGACTVLVDGKRDFSCSTSVAHVDGKTVLTIEGWPRATRCTRCRRRSWRRGRSSAATARRA